MTAATTVRPVCAGKPPEWWDTGDGGNRLALGLCSVCPARTGDTCAAGLPDPSPSGVIRAGIAYSNTGVRLPICADCGYPNTNYGGGAVGNCPWCGVPEIFASPVAHRATITSLHQQGLEPSAIAEHIGAKPTAVRSACKRWGLVRRPRTQQKEAA